MGALCGKAQQQDELPTPDNKLQIEEKRLQQQLMLERKMRDQIQKRLDEYIQIIEATTVKDGLNTKEIWELKRDAQNIEEDLEGMEGDKLKKMEGEMAVAKQKMEDLKKERTEHINGISLRVEMAKKELQGFITSMRENMDSENQLITETQSMLDQVTEIEEEVNAFKKEHNPEDKKQLKGIKIQITNFHNRLNQISENHLDLKIRQIKQETEPLKANLKTWQREIIGTKINIKKIREGTNMMDGYESDQYEKDLFNTVGKESNDISKGLDHTNSKIQEIYNLINVLELTLDINKISSVQVDADMVLTAIKKDQLVIEGKEQLMQQMSNQKVFKRDEELDQIAFLCKDLYETLEVETYLLKNEIKIINTKLQSFLGMSSTKLKCEQIKKDLVDYQNELNTLKKSIEELESKRQIVQAHFDDDVPSTVQQYRIKRRKECNDEIYELMEDKYLQEEIEMNQEPSQTSSHFINLFNINNDVKASVQQLKKLIMEIQTKKLSLVDKYASLEEDLGDLEDGRYKAVKGDKIDEFFASYINDTGITVDIKRVREGVYQIGNQQVAMKIKNSNLAVRSGGGYVKASEFIERFTQNQQTILKKQDTFNKKKYTAGGRLIRDSELSDNSLSQKIKLNIGKRNSMPDRFQDNELSEDLSDESDDDNSTPFVQDKVGNPLQKSGTFLQRKRMKEKEKLLQNQGGSARNIHTKLNLPTLPGSGRKSFDHRLTQSDGVDGSDGGQSQVSFISKSSIRAPTKVRYGKTDEGQKNSMKLVGLNNSATATTPQYTGLVRIPTQTKTFFTNNSENNSEMDQDEQITHDDTKTENDCLKVEIEQQENPIQRSNSSIKPPTKIIK